MPVEVTEDHIRIRVRAPGDFQDRSSSTIPLKRDKPRVNAVAGRLKGENVLMVQSLLFPKADGWTREDSVKWARDHDYSPKGRQEGAPEEEAIEAPLVEDVERANLYSSILLSGASLMAKRNRSEPIWKTPVCKAVTVDEDRGRASVIISTNDIDRDREEVVPDGMVIPKPRRVPLVSSHSYFDLRKQIGDVGRPKQEGSQINAEPTWFIGLGNPESDWGFTLVKLGVAAFSIGFIPQAWEDADLDDEKTIDAIKAGKKPMRRYTKWELVEVSQVIVPSNRAAVQRMSDVGLLDPGVVKGLNLTDEPMSEAAQAGFEKALEVWVKEHPVEEDKAQSDPKPDDVIEIEVDDVTPGRANGATPQTPEEEADYARQHQTQVDAVTGEVRVGPADERPADDVTRFFTDLEELGAVAPDEKPQVVTPGDRAGQTKEPFNLDELRGKIIEEVATVFDKRMVQLEKDLALIETNGMTQEKVAEMVTAAVNAATGARPWADDEVFIRSIFNAVMTGVHETVERRIKRATGDVDEYRM